MDDVVLVLDEYGNPTPEEATTGKTKIRLEADGKVIKDGEPCSECEKKMEKPPTESHRHNT